MVVKYFKCPGKSRAIQRAGMDTWFRVSCGCLRQTLSWGCTPASGSPQAETLDLSRTYMPHPFGPLWSAFSGTPVLESVAQAVFGSEGKSTGVGVQLQASLTLWWQVLRFLVHVWENKKRNKPAVGKVHASLGILKATFYSMHTALGKIQTVNI